MRSALCVLLFGCGLALTAATAETAPLRRFALIVGANDGGSGRPVLRYAVSDAERFGRVLVDLGGVAAADAIVLKQPGAGDLEQSLTQLRARVGDARQAARAAGGGRTEVLVYYSGHADEKGLLLGDDRYSYRSLRDQLDALPADVRIAVLDACASGAITRLKGGKERPAFLVDEAADMQGHAFLTSSSETEAAQESDRIGGSYFTHFLLSGLRGAADASGEGKVTLNEAYQFAFSETLGRTVDTNAGAQHPSYDINMSGSGDVVMTDLRQTSATLVLGESLDGRFFVRNARQELVVELHKPYGRRIELGLEPGRYEVRVEREAAALLAKPELAEGGRVTLEPNQFTATRSEMTRTRGGFGERSVTVGGRNRIDAQLGLWDKGSTNTAGAVFAGTDEGSLLVGIRFTRFLSETLAISAGLEAAPGPSGTVVATPDVFAGDSTVFSIPIAAHWNPFPSWGRAELRPHLSVGLGPVFGTAEGTSVSGSRVIAGTHTEVSIGGDLGVGVDLHLGRAVSLGLDAGYRWMADFPEPVGARDNYSGFTLAVRVGWLFGKGSGPSR
jgi:hypothetical protein